MKQHNRSSFLWLVVPLVLAALLVQGAPIAEAAATCARWKVVPTPNVTGMNTALNGVSALSSRDAWAVGYSWNNTTGTSQTLIERWNGTKWRIVASPNPNRSGNRLNAVLALSASNVWAVGSTILHWNGRTWSVLTNPDPTASLFALAASSARDIWAVGAGSHGTLTEHWNGRVWKVVSSPTPPGFLDTLWGVTVVSATDAWAVGDYFVSLEPPHNLTLILHWNGKSWTVVPSPSPTSSFNVLHSVVAASAKDVWAVGNTSSSSNPNIDRTMIQHWNGTKWNLVASPNRSAFSNALLSVAVVSTKNIWAVGYYNNGTPSDQTLTEQWNGTRWKAVSSPNGGADVNILQSVTRVSRTGQVWAVGDFFDRSTSAWKTLAEYFS